MRWCSKNTKIPAAAQKLLLLLIAIGVVVDVVDGLSTPQEHLAILELRQRWDIAQLVVSSTADSEFKHFLSQLCLSNINETRQHEMFLQWEQTEFLQNLRIMLEPSTASGDFRHILSSPLMTAENYRMFVDHDVPSNCTTRNPTKEAEKHEAKKTSDEFENKFIDAIFNMKLIVDYNWPI